MNIPHTIPAYLLENAIRQQDQVVVSSKGGDFKTIAAAGEVYHNTTTNSLDVGV